MLKNWLKNKKKKIREDISYGELAGGVIYGIYEVTAVALDPQTKEIISEERIETINTENNEIFQDAKDAEDVKRIYESYWNDIPNPKEIIKVIEVKEIDSDWGYIHYPEKESSTSKCSKINSSDNLLNHGVILLGAEDKIFLYSSADKVEKKFRSMNIKYNIVEQGMGSIVIEYWSEQKEEEIYDILNGILHKDIGLEVMNYDKYNKEINAGDVSNIE